MKITVHTLFKNDERWLWYSVSSVVNFVDKILLWDTASTDNSWKLAQLLKEKYPNKIDLRQYDNVTVQNFYKARQQMLDETESGWFLVVDADEIWWENSVGKIVDFIRSNNEPKIESIVVPTVNAVGDLYHKQPDEAGNYEFGGLRGNYSLRAVKTSLPGLHCSGDYGVEGWIDEDGKPIQKRETYKFFNAPYIHTTFLPRSKDRSGDLDVIKRSHKLKYEIGEKLAKDYYYPESFFYTKPDLVSSPWQVMTNSYKTRAFLQSPFKKLKRRFKLNTNVGY